MTLNLGLGTKENKLKVQGSKEQVPIDSGFEARLQNKTSQGAPAPKTQTESMFEAQASTPLNFKPETLNSSSLAYFRIFFGFMMLYSSIRFLAKGWVQELYIDTTFHFKYWGFEWVEPLGNLGTHALFFGIALTAFFVMIGLFYRIAIALFFLLFSYAELMDATNYLNHYYFVSIIAFILIWLPANTAFSVNALRNTSLKNILVPNWAVNVLKLQIALVYVFAGVAKINYDWLIEAEPLFHWLRAKYDFPILGPLFQYKATAYFFSWSGCLYDLTVPFLLLYKPTRKLAFTGVVFFHVITSLLFPIGVFPFVMIGSATLFFSSTWHLRALRLLASLGYAVQSLKSKVAAESQFKVQNSKEQVPVESSSDALLRNTTWPDAPAPKSRTESKFKAQSLKEQTITFIKNLTPFPMGKGWGLRATTGVWGKNTNFKLETLNSTTRGSEAELRNATLPDAPEDRFEAQLQNKTSLGAPSPKSRIESESKVQSSKESSHPLTLKLKTLNFKLSTIKSILAIHFIIQIALPFRHYLYPSNLYWTEEGYRFSWRVMLTDKAGLAFFTVKDANGKENLVDLDAYLTERQQNFLATNPDFMVQFAHFLKVEYAKKDYKNPEVFVESYLNLNGKGSRAFTNPNVDLAKESWGLSPKTWLLPINNIES